MKKIIIGIVICSCLLFVFMFNNNQQDVLKYNNRHYVYLDLNGDVFTYFYNRNDILDEETITDIDHDVYDLVYNQGDVYILKNQLRDAKDYYSQDDHYKWYANYEMEEATLSSPLVLSEDELDYIYNLDQMNKEITISFDDIELFVDLVKVSQDELIYGVINLVKCKGEWYYKTEIMSEDDQEYVIALPESLHQKLNQIVIDMQID